MFGLKEPYFLPDVATNLSKNTDFATSVHLSIDMSCYWNLKIKYVLFTIGNSIEKVIFLVARPDQSLFCGFPKYMYI